MHGEYPNFTCSILSSVPYPVFCQHIIGTISGFQAFAKIDPVTYLSFNHEKARKLALVLNILVFTGECVCVAVVNGTICSKADVAVIQSLTGLQLTLKTTQVLSLYSLLIGLLPRVVYCWVSNKQKNSFTNTVSSRIISTRFADNVVINIDVDLNETAGRSMIETVVVPSTSDNGAEQQNLILSIDVSTLELDMENAAVPINSETIAVVRTERSSIVVADNSNHGKKLLKNNKVNPDDVSRTNTPYILDFNAIVISCGIFLFIAILVIAIASPEKWWINLYVVNLITFICMVYWVHSSEEISDYAMRKLTQLLGDSI